MDELTKVWQVWNRTKINRLECDSHKNVNANRVKLCKRTTRKLRATKNLFKVEHCGSSLLTSNRKIWVLGKLLISKWNHKQKRAVEVVANGVHTAKLKTESHLRRRKREGLALMAADVWVWCKKVQYTIQRVQPDRGHLCGSKHNKSYDSTGFSGLWSDN